MNIMAVFVTTFTKSELDPFRFFFLYFQGDNIESKEKETYFECLYRMPSYYCLQYITLFADIDIIDLSICQK